MSEGESMEIARLSKLARAVFKLALRDENGAGNGTEPGDQGSAKMFLYSDVPVWRERRELWKSLAEYGMGAEDGQ